jgi:hypothetical protein
MVDLESQTARFHSRETALFFEPFTELRNVFFVVGGQDDVGVDHGVSRVGTGRRAEAARPLFSGAGDFNRMQPLVRMRPSVRIHRHQQKCPLAGNPRPRAMRDFVSSQALCVWRESRHPDQDGDFASLGSSPALLSFVFSTRLAIVRLRNVAFLMRLRPTLPEARARSAPSARLAAAASQPIAV